MFKPIPSYHSSTFNAQPSQLHRPDPEPAPPRPTPAPPLSPSLQSPDIGQGVHGLGTKTLEEIGAGDQGHMFGYATDETPELMPLTHVLATKLGYRLTEVRKNGTVPWLRPDGKTQVTVEYRKEGGAVVPIRVHTILISTQHNPDVSNEKIHADLIEHVIKPVVPAKYLDDNTIFHLNPSGRFVIGGPHGDAGLTGRKIIIDTYGGWGAHGGGAFSGKVGGAGGAGVEEEGGGRGLAGSHCVVNAPQPGAKAGQPPKPWLRWWPPAGPCCSPLPYPCWMPPRCPC